MSGSPHGSGDSGGYGNLQYSPTSGAYNPHSPMYNLTSPGIKTSNYIYIYIYIVYNPASPAYAVRPSTVAQGEAGSMSPILEREDDDMDGEKGTKQEDKGL